MGLLFERVDGFNCLILFWRLSWFVCLVNTDMDDPVIIANGVRRAAYDRLLQRPIKGRWYHEPTMRAFGMHDAIAEAFAIIGASRLLEPIDWFYPALTAEFMATLELRGGRHPQIHFQLGNEEYRLTLAQLSAHFGFPPSDERLPIEENSRDKL